METRSSTSKPTTRSFTSFPLVSSTYGEIFASSQQHFFLKLCVSGAEYNDTSGTVSPGLALYHHGMDLVALVCTDHDVYHLRVRGQLRNSTWVNMGIVYDPAGSMNKGDIKVLK